MAYCDARVGEDKCPHGAVIGIEDDFRNLPNRNPTRRELAITGGQDLVAWLDDYIFDDIEDEPVGRLAASQSRDWGGGEQQGTHPRRGGGDECDLARRLVNRTDDADEAVGGYNGKLVFDSVLLTRGDRQPVIKRKVRDDFGPNCLPTIDRSLELGTKFVNRRGEYPFNIRII